MESRNEKLKKVLEKVDLTETQRSRAVELYTHVCEAIEDSGLEINFYPQGSFATKTAVRPYKNGKNQAYDVDVICELTMSKLDITPDELKSKFRDALTNSRYSNKFVEHDKCFTINFAEQDGVDFSIDIIPSVPEDNTTKIDLCLITENPFLVETSLAIPNLINDNTYTWITNNPKGYTEWFEQSIQKFHKKYLLEKRDSSVSASIEELPDEEPENMLLNVIKILKRTRDVFYYRRNSENKPSSIIITTIVGKLAQDLRPTNSEFDLFEQVVNQLKFIESYSSKEISKSMFITGYSISDIITRKFGEWTMNNPANGKDNILNSWNENEDKANEFFSWINNLQKVSSELIEKNSDDEKSLNEFYDVFAVEISESKTNRAQFSVTDSSSKPWKKVNA